MDKDLIRNGTVRVEMHSLAEIEIPEDKTFPFEEVYWAVYNAAVEEMHPHVPSLYWHTEEGKAIRHAIAGNACQRLWDDEVHRPFRNGL